MKKYFIIIISTFLVGNMSSQILTPACRYLDNEWGKVPLFSLDCEQYEAGDWILVFNDEFDESQINSTIWHTCVEGWNREHGNELQYYLDENITLDDGNLFLTAKEEPGDYLVHRWDQYGNHYTEYKFFEYTSGWIETKMKFKYGLFEVKCWIPEGSGFWPAFWLWGTGEGLIPEVDILEFNGIDTKKHTITTHLWDFQLDLHDQCATSKSYGIDFSQGWHIFSVEWDEFKIVYRVDGYIKRIDYTYFDTNPYGLYECWDLVPGIYTGPNPYRTTTPCSVILNLAISPGEGVEGAFGPAPDENTVFPGTYKIDYIRVYRRNNSQKDINICDLNFNEISSVQTGNIINIGGAGCNSEIKDGEFLSLLAANKIVHGLGFKVDFGSHYSASLFSNKSNEKFVQVLNQSNIKINDNKEILEKEVTSLFFNEVKIFPNPVDTYLHVVLQGNLEEFIKLELLNISGEILFNQYKFKNETIRLDVSSFPKGIYILNIITKLETLNQKIIIN